MEPTFLQQRRRSNTDDGTPRPTHERCQWCGKQIAIRLRATHQKSISCTAERVPQQRRNDGWRRVYISDDEKRVWERLGLVIEYDVEGMIRSGRSTRLDYGNWAKAEFVEVWESVEQRHVRIALLERYVTDPEFPALFEATRDITRGLEYSERRHRIADLVGLGPCRHPHHPMVDANGCPCCAEVRTASVRSVYFEGAPNLGRRLADRRGAL